MILPYRGKGKFLINGGLCGVELCPALWPVRTDMETHVVRRPVYGGPARMLLKKRRATIPCGGSRGPADPWSAAAASKRRDLWFFRSRKNNDVTICWQRDGRKAKPGN